jgi:hypothetical protein
MPEAAVVAPVETDDDDFASASDRTVCIKRPFSMSEVAASGAK